MPILEQGYEPYRGTVKRGGLRFLSIAAAALRRNRRWYVWVLLLFSLLFGSGKEAIFLFIAYVPAAFFGVDSNKIDAFIRAFADHPRFYTDMMSSQAFWAIVMGITVGAGEIAEDLRSGGLVFYLGRPVTRLDYLLGKTVSVSFVVSLVTLVPALFLFTVQSLFEGEWAWFRDHLRVLPAILGFTVILCLFVSGLVLGVSAIARRRLWATVSIAGCLLGLWTVAAVLAPPEKWTAQSEQREAHRAIDQAKTREERREAIRKFSLASDELGSRTETASWRALSPTSSLGAVARDLFGNEVPPNFRFGVQWVFVLGIPAAFFGLLWRRIRAVEIVT